MPQELIDLINEKIPASTPAESQEVTAGDINEVLLAVNEAIDDGGSGGGASDFADLDDAATVDIPAINTPTGDALQALQDQIDALSGGGGTPGTVITFVSAIPLSRSNTIMSKVLTANLVLTEDPDDQLPGAGGTIRIQQGAGSYTVTFPAGWIELAGSANISTTPGTIHQVIYFYNGTDKTYSIAQIGVSDITAPTLTSATVENATPDHIDLVWGESMNSTMSAAAAFAVSAGHSLTAHTFVDATHSYLTTSTAFTNGETARTLAYTQPASNKMQDLAGNLLANITAATITNNVAAPDITAPTLVSATVEDASPTHVDLVFSEAMNSTWSAFSAFTVSGHTASAITRTGSTTGYLIVDAFTNGETATIAYTAPGSNKMQDLAGNLLVNFSGTAITDNVGAVGTGLAPLDFTGSTDIIASGSDWVYDPTSGFTGFGNLGKANVAIPANSAGRIILTHITGSGSNGCNLGLYTANTEVGYASMVAGFAIGSAGSAVYGFHTSGTVSFGPFTLASPSSACLYRDASGNMYLQTSPLGSYTWTTVYTFPITSTAKLYVVADINGSTNPGILVDAEGENLVP